MASPTLLFRTAALGLLALATLSGRAQNLPEGRVQDRNFNSWLVYDSDARLTDRWGLHTEGQWRRSQGVKKPMQDLARVGLNFYAGDHAILTVGYAFALTHPYGDYPVAESFPEQRMYEQVLLRNAHGPFQMTHRYRLEQRWLRLPEQDTYTYSNRIRYQFRTVLPLAGPMEVLHPNTPYLVASEELFVNFGSNVASQNIFDQNRAYAGVGYQITQATAVELGYLHQLLAQSNGNVYEHNHTVQVSVNFNPDFR